MWLFDELLHKPSNEGANPSGGASAWSTWWSQWGNPPAQDPLAGAAIKIEKTEEIPLQTEPVFSNTYNEPKMDPNPAAISGATAEDGNALLVGVVETPVASTDVPLTVEATPIASPVVVSETPLQENSSINLLSLETETQVVSDNDALISLSTPVQVTEIQENNWGLLSLTENTETREEAPTIAETPSSPISFAQPETVSETLIPVIEEEAKEEVISLVSQEEAKAEPSAIPVFSDPTSFITDSLAKIEIMLQAMQDKHNAKLVEADGYKSEKERFAELENQAYRDAESMTAEMDHAERMKSYFTKELKHTEEKKHKPTESTVETTLTTLAVKNTVEWVTEKSEVHKDAKAKMEV